MKNEEKFQWKIHDIIGTFLQTKENPKKENKTSKKRKIDSKKIQQGGISIKDINFFVVGVSLIWNGSRDWINNLQQNMVDGKIDVTKAKIMFTQLNSTINDSIRILMMISEKKDKLKKGLEFFEKNKESFQLAQDGMITLERNGKTEYISSSELYDMLIEYEKINKVFVKDIDNYVAVGVDFISLIGSLFNNNDEKNKNNVNISFAKEIFELVYMSTFYKKFMNQNKMNELLEQIRSNQSKSVQLKNMLIEGKLISETEREEIMKKIQYYDENKYKLEIKYKSKGEMLYIAKGIATSIITGIYIISALKNKGENQKLDYKDYAKILTSIRMEGIFARDLIESINEIIHLRENRRRTK